MQAVDALAKRLLQPGGALRAHGKRRPPRLALAFALSHRLHSCAASSSG